MESESSEWMLAVWRHEWVDGMNGRLEAEDRIVDGLSIRLAWYSKVILIAWFVCWFGLLWSYCLFKRWVELSGWDIG